MTRTVNDVMTRTVVSVGARATVGDLRDRMDDDEVTFVPVLDDFDHAVGVVSAVDLLDVDDPTTPVRWIMSDDVQSIEAGHSVREAAARMREERVHHLVVLRGGHVAGVLSAFDLLGEIADAR